MILLKTSSIIKAWLYILLFIIDKETYIMAMLELNYSFFLIKLIVIKFNFSNNLKNVSFIANVIYIEFFHVIKKVVCFLIVIPTNLKSYEKI